MAEGRISRDWNSCATRASSSTNSGADEYGSCRIDRNGRSGVIVGRLDR